MCALDYLCLLFVLAVILLPQMSSSQDQPTNTDENNSGLVECKKSHLSVIRAIIPPYTFPSNNPENPEDRDDPAGPIHDIVVYARDQCCGSNVSLVTSRVTATERQVEEKMKGEDLAYPVVKTGNLGIAAGTVERYLFVPVLESPGAVILVLASSNVDNVVVQSLSQCWPLALVVLSSAGLAGVIVWLLDHSRNPDDFAESFVKGGWEGIWWAFVTMTTVGYGDKAPKSIPGRLFGLVWMFVGIILMSIFTATLTTALTADNSAHFEVKGTKIGIVKGSKEGIVAFKEGADIEEFLTLRDLKDALLDGSIEGALVDSNYALSKGTDLDELGIKIAMSIVNPAILGIILQGLGAEVETCFTKFISKSQFKAYDSLAKHVQKFSKDDTPSATKATQRVLLSMKTVFIALFCIWFAVTLACVAWEFLYRKRILTKKAAVTSQVGVWPTDSKDKQETSHTVVHS